MLSSMFIPIASSAETTTDDTTTVSAIEETTNVGDNSIGGTSICKDQWNTDIGTSIESDFFGAGKDAIRVTEDHDNLNWASCYTLANDIELDTYYTVSWKQKSTSDNPTAVGMEFVIQKGGGFPRVTGGVFTTSGTEEQTFYMVMKFNSKHFGESASRSIGLEMRNHPSESRVSKDQKNTGDGDVFVGDFKVYKGKNIPGEARETKAFGGTDGRIRISKEGAWTIDNEDVFPMFVYSHAGRFSTQDQNYVSLSEHGFNGVNNGGNVSDGDLSKEAVIDNNIWFSIQLRGALAQGGDQLEWLKGSLDNIKSQGLQSHVKMFSIDNEMLTKDFPFWEETKDIITAFDPNGEIPIVMLDGAIGMGDNYKNVDIAQIGAYHDYIDYTTTDNVIYNNTAESRAEASLGMAFSGNHKATSGLIQINSGSDIDLFAGILFGGIANGGTHMQHWADEVQSSEGFPTNMGIKDWYSKLPTYREHIDIMVEKGIIHGKAHTDFMLTTDDAKFASGTRIAKDGKAYIIIAANTTDGNTFSSGIQSLPYETTGNLVDIFTGQVAAKITNGQFEIILSGNDYKVLYVEEN